MSFSVLVLDVVKIFHAELSPARTVQFNPVKVLNNDHISKMGYAYRWRVRILHLPHPIPLLRHDPTVHETYIISSKQDNIMPVSLNIYCNDNPTSV